MSNCYKILFIDDDEDEYKIFRYMLENYILSNNEQVLISTSDFENGLKKIKKSKYDIIICDIFNNKGEINGETVIQEIRKANFCPLIMFSNEKPDYIKEPFIQFVKKDDMHEPEKLQQVIDELIKTGLPKIMKKIYSDIENYTRDYAWGYVEEKWNSLSKTFTKDGTFCGEKLEKIIRNRIANKINTEDKQNCDWSDYYLVPPLNQQAKLGSIIKYGSDNDYRIVLTPHCYFQEYERNDETYIKINNFLTAKCFSLDEVKEEKKPEVNNSIKKEIKKLIKIPILNISGFTPSGRYCFLPSLPSEFEDLFCDLNALETLPMEGEDFTIVADLLSPYAEALQSAFTRYYANVGTPDLNSEDFMHLDNSKIK